MGIPQIVFVIVFGITFYLAFRKYREIVSAILLAKPIKTEGPVSERIKNTLLVAFGQRKMFKNLLPAFMHLFIYVAFLFTQIKLIEIIWDGFAGTHRVLAMPLGSFYTVLVSFIEILSLLALVATIVFLWRRNLLKIPRFNKAEMTRWPKLDANIILIGELVLLFGIFTYNGADMVLQSRAMEGYPDTGALVLSSWFGPAFFGSLSDSTLVLLERGGWWIHLFAVFGFLVYLPYSKHLHIMFAFPNTYFAKLRSRGEMENMPEIMNEVKSMMGLSEETQVDGDMDEIPEFGAKDIFGLDRVNLLGAFSCTECGRCTASCPANITGKKLSPRKIVMDIRDRAEEVISKINSGNPEYIAEDKKGEGVALNASNFDDGKSLFDYISSEELHACTTCNACVEACPVLIDPLEPILKMRRYEILTESAGPQDWMPMFNSLENNASPWPFNQADRANWSKEESQ
ncbi:MAG: (Fe-S)-binding protein [Saprospirales bacterium]|nr:MAG: (Fe-S)-binding protein [Saprospirales bacterium]